MRRALIITASNRASAGVYKDLSGAALKEGLKKIGYEVVGHKLVQDDMHQIATTIKSAIEEEIDLIVTTGGTGVSPTDVTPEATKPLIERAIPGFMEALRDRTVKIDIPYITKLTEEKLLAALGKQAGAAPNPFVIGTPAVVRGLNVMGECAMAQRDPLIEYKAEAFKIFDELMVNIKTEICHNIFRSASSMMAFEQFLVNLPQLQSQHLSQLLSQLQTRSRLQTLLRLLQLRHL